MLAAIDGEMTRAEIMVALGLRNTKHFRIHYQQAAVSRQLIEMTIPSKPNSRLQKYRLTQAGRRLLVGQG
jgi:ATP-dependent DNA helicase RecG